MDIDTDKSHYNETFRSSKPVLCSEILSNLHRPDSIRQSVCFTEGLLQRDSSITPSAMWKIIAEHLQCIRAWLRIVCCFCQNIGWVPPKTIYFYNRKQYFQYQSIPIIVYAILKTKSMVLCLSEPLHLHPDQ